MLLPIYYALTPSEAYAAATRASGQNQTLETVDFGTSR
jgi:hypothetical protein